MCAASSSGQSTAVYQKLDETRKQIRLVTVLPTTEATSLLRCELEAVFLDDGSEYEALSYCWGDPHITQKISLQGVETKVTANLYAALLQYRSEEKSPRLWIDALCINQADIEERSHQVAMMRDIYQAASRVRIWLGPSVQSTAREFDFITRLLHQDLTTSQPSIWQSVEDFYSQGPDSANDWCDLVRFFGNNYWHRTWTIQERAVASALRIQSGAFATEMDDMMTLLNKTTPFLIYCTKRSRELYMPPTSLRLAPGGHERVTAFLAQERRLIHILGNHIVYDFSDHPERIALPSFLAFIARTGVTDPRDHVYGTLGLFPQLNIVPDYTKSLEEVYTDFALQLLEVRRSFEIFYLPNPPDSALPSWIPDLHREVSASTPYPLEGYGRAIKLFDASLRTSFNFSRLGDESLIVPGMIIDRIAPLPSRYHTDSTVTLFDGEQDTLDEAFLKSLCFGVVPTKNSPSTLRRWDEQHARLYKILWQCLAERTELPPEAMPYYRHMDRARNAQEPFFTEKGAFGSAQPQVPFRVGDFIAVLASLSLPLVLRQVEETDAYRVIGACYLNGEAVLKAAGGDAAGKEGVFQDVCLV